jgi:hypothetical protein
MDDNTLGIIVILGIIAIAAFGGVKSSQNGGLFNIQPAPVSQSQNNANIESQIQQAQTQVDDLKKQIQLEEDKKTQSQYKDIVNLQYVNRASTPSQEYIVIQMSNYSTSTIPITGWTLKSLRTGNVVNIPKAAYLIFAGSVSTEDNIVLTGGDVVYVNTGTSPNGYSFKANKCSGYMSQFQNYTPYFSTNCPAPRNEDLSSIPDTINNEKCYDFIESYPTCRIQTDPLPLGLSSECQNFIYNKINYGSCVKAHQYDKDFYLHEWRVFLRRGDTLWRDRRENIVLYDNLGKVVDTLTY